MLADHTRHLFPRTSYRHDSWLRKAKLRQCLHPSQLNLARFKKEKSIIFVKAKENDGTQPSNIEVENNTASSSEARINASESTNVQSVISSSNLPSETSSSNDVNEPSSSGEPPASNFFLPLQIRYPPYVQQVFNAIALALSICAGALQNVAQSLQRIPAWAHATRLKQLKSALDLDPTDANKHAAYLCELNVSAPAAVIAHVDSRKYASNSAVVVEYLTALVKTGKLTDYAAVEQVRSGDLRSLPMLLEELRTASLGETGDGSAGSSYHRPFHVTILGGLSAMGDRQASGPLQAVWRAIVMLSWLLLLSGAWLMGTNAVRRSQMANLGGSSSSSSAAIAAATQSSSSSGGNLSTDPKEYKKEDIPEKSQKSFNDVLGCDEAKEELREVVEFLKHPAKFSALGAKLPKGVLLTGPPGTGKTLLARAVAGEAGVPFFYRAGSEFEELYVGVGSRRMRALFSAAKKKAPCIVFIDEIDAIGGNRKHWENHTRKTLNQLLTEMDGFEVNESVIVLAATNLPETLDPALKRPGRFDRQVAVPLPDTRGRLQILTHYLNEKPVKDDVDKDLLSRQTQGFSGADIANLVNEAALMAAKQGAPAINSHMLEVAFDKIRMGVERKSAVRSLEGRRRTAYHEAGHALVALNTPGAAPLHKATIMPRGHALGMVTQVARDDEFSINRQQMEARILVCMGGTVSEELIFGRDQVTSGATDDLKQATNMARHMVAECGLSDVVGPVYIEDEKNMSEATRQIVDNEVRSMLVNARQEVANMLREKVEDLHLLAEALLEHETLTGNEIKDLLRGEFKKESANGSTRAPQPGDIIAVTQVQQPPAA